MSIVARFVRQDYTLADAFRPHPGWGTQQFTCPDDKAVGVSDADLIAGARANKPNGYRLQSVIERKTGVQDRVLWCEPASRMFRPMPQPETELED